MIARLANVYVGVVFAVLLALTAVTLFAHISMLLGHLDYVGLDHRILFCLLFGPSFAAIGLARERNVWRNEFKACPMWMRIATVLLAIYAWTGGFFMMALGPDNSASLSDTIATTVMPLFFYSLPLCIPYSLLWASPVSHNELIQRVGKSLAAVGLAAVFFFIGSYVHKPHHF